MDKKTSFIAYGTLFLLCVRAILDLFDFFGITTSSFTPYLAEINLCILIGLPILLFLLVVTVVNSHKTGIRQFLMKRSHSKLLSEITKELENQATSKNLTFLHHKKDFVLNTLAKQVTIDIENSHTPKNYSVQRMMDKVGDVWISGHIFSIPFKSAKILADKMTELSNDPKYRKKGYL